MNNSEKIKAELEKEEIPRSLEADMIQKMLEEKAPAKKRSRIKLAARVTAAAAAAAIIGTGAAHIAGNISPDRSASGSGTSGGSHHSPSKPNRPSDGKELPDASYMKGAESYGEVYELISKQCSGYEINYGFAIDSEIAMEAPGAVPKDPGALTGMEGNGEFDGANEIIGTYDQEKGVLEADKVKTDGKNIYYADGTSSTIRIAETKNGKFTDTAVLDPKKDLDVDDWWVRDMYVYNGMLVLIGQEFQFARTSSSRLYDEAYFVRNTNMTKVLFYTLGTEPELIDTYTQDGSYGSARITPDGSLCLITNYYSAAFSDIEDESCIGAYIPKLGMGNDEDYIEAGCILLPCETEEDSSLSYVFTVVGSVDLNKSGKPELSDKKAFAGYTGEVYCSAENLYCTSGWDDTEITRVSISGGKITPAANGKVEGNVLSQFSMSEYNGYFRIATTKDTYKEVEGDGFTYAELEKRDNRLYVLDMELKEVGSVKDYGVGENIRSVNFNGDMAYVVTFLQTDPLFAIDLTDPKSPKLLSELKVSGFSTYMQSWTDGLLLGFGSEADKNGRVTGVKLEMFDNSDPNNLKTAGKHLVIEDTQSSYSPAVDDRKCLLISPEKNLICVPFREWRDYYDYDADVKQGYMIFSYEDGKFVERGCFARSQDTYMRDFFDRAVYIDGYVYIISGERYVSIDAASFKEKDEAEF